MNNPIYANTIKYYIQFENVSDEWLEIFEPVYSDANDFTIEQNPNNCTRDINYGEGKLRFINTYSAEATEVQIINPQGDTSNHLSHLLGWWFYVLQKWSFGAKINYKQNIDGIDTKIFSFDLQGDKLTDFNTYVEAELVDTGKVAGAKRVLETSFNAFSDKDWSGNTISPMPTFDYLSRAIPLFNKSRWEIIAPKTFNVFDSDTLYTAFNFSQKQTKYEVKNSLLWIDDKVIAGLANQHLFEDFTIIKAKNRLTDLKITIDFKLKYDVYDNPFISDSLGGGELKLLLYKGNSIENSTLIHTFYSNSWDAGEHPSITLQDVYEYTIPIVSTNERVYLFWRVLSNVGNTTIITQEYQNIDVEAIETAPDIVVKASRYIDLIKQTSKFRENIPVSASQYDVGGIHYDNAVITKRMISRKTDSFNVTPKKVYDSLIETNSHVEMFEDEIYINHQREFYKNVEIGVLQANTSKDYSVSINPKSAVNLVDLGFTVFEQDRTTSGTSESIHTEAQFRIIEEKSENKFSRKFEFSRDGLAFQKAKDLEVNNPTTSTQDDDVVYVEKFVSLAPNSFGIQKGVFLISATESPNIIEILNTDLNGDNEDYSFTWDSLGIGTTCEITLSGITSQATVLEITPTKLKLSPVYPFTGTGDYFVSIKYYYTGVLYQTATNQNYLLIEGVTNKMSNLDYSIGRIVRNYFSEQLANYSMYCQKDIVCGYFKSIPDSRIVKTQRNDETTFIIENAVIDYDSLPNPLIDGWIIEYDAVANYGVIKDIETNYRTNRGFVRFYDWKNDKVEFGFIQKLSYNAITGKVMAKFERKYTPLELAVNGTSENLTINDVPYNLIGVANWWKMRNGFLSFYDKDSIPLCNEYEYNLVILNGVRYNSAEELSDALSLLIV